MGRKKLILFALLTMFLAYGSVTTTYAYFSVKEKVADNINVELGSINANFANSEGAVISTEIVNIQGILPGEEKETAITIKNTGTLTNKIAVGLSNPIGEGIASLLPYLSCKIIIENKSLECKLSELASKTIELRDGSGKPILLKKDGKANGKIIIKLDQDTPYSEQYKTLRFNLNIYSSQPNDSDWHDK
jgi:hypothetical protein